MRRRRISYLDTYRNNRNGFFGERVSEGLGNYRVFLVYGCAVAGGRLCRRRRHKLRKIPQNFPSVISPEAIYLLPWCLVRTSAACGRFGRAVCRRSFGFLNRLIGYRGFGGNLPRLSMLPKKIGKILFNFNS